MIPIANQLAQAWKTKADFFLALSAMESGWDPVYSGPTHAVPINNSFGLTQVGHNDLTFSSIQAAAAYWSSIDGQYVNGAQSINAFATNLYPHYNTGPSWIGTLSDGYNSVLNRIINCGY
jgi:hypothetical protein